MADHNQIDTHLMKFNRDKFGYTKSLPLRSSSYVVEFFCFVFSRWPHSLVDVYNVLQLAGGWELCTCMYVCLFIFP